MLSAYLENIVGRLVDGIICSVVDADERREEAVLMPKLARDGPHSPQQEAKGRKEHFHIYREVPGSSPYLVTL